MFLNAHSRLHSTFEDTSVLVWSQVLSTNNREIISTQEPLPTEPGLGLFAKLPYEIRQQIWQYLYHPPKHNIFRYCAKRQTFFRTGVLSPERSWPAILCTSRQIHDEACETLYRQHLLHIRIHPYGGWWRLDDTPTLECYMRPCFTYKLLLNSRYFSKFRKMKSDVVAPWQGDRRLDDWPDEHLERI